MSKEEKSEKKPEFQQVIKKDPTKIFNQSLDSLWKRLINEIKDSFKLGKDVDFEDTIESIEEDAKYHGYNIWILMCSIVVASVGLNNNSPAVIIGAMLISPLMGPIRGIGLGFGIIDFALITTSLKNFFKMTLVSLMVSYAYFFTSPIQQETSELLNRTAPTLLDIFVAFFGGLAGIIAATRGNRDTVVPGVAIATALMPPLCTAGYALATVKWSYFFGAMYLFLLNSLFICFSTIVIVRYLKFPTREFLNSTIKKRVHIYMIISTIIIIIPAGILFYQIVKESIFVNNSESFYLEVIRPSITDKDIKVRFKSKYIEPDSTYMELDIAHGNVPDKIISSWKEKAAEYNLQNTTFKIFHRQFRFQDFQHIDSLIQQAPEAEKHKAIAFYKKQVDSLKNLLDQKELKQWNVTALKEHLLIDYPKIQKVSLAKEIAEDIKENKDTTYVVTIYWKKKLSKKQLKSVHDNIHLRTMHHLKQYQVFPDSLLVKMK